MTSGGQVFMLECSSCGAKIANTGAVVGGHESCDPHKYGPIGGFIAKPKKQKIVYPTDAERNWLRIIDQNKNENDKHYEKFDNDEAELNKFKSTAMKEIESMIKALRIKLDERQEALEQEVNDAFDERQEKMKENMKRLKEHKRKNEETKEQSEELLLSDKPVTEREKKIVADCENIINTTPDLRYIETELRYTFEQLISIERKISSFGKLHTRPIDSGQRCLFKSTKDAVAAPSSAPKILELPSIQLKSSTFDDKKQKVKLGFKIVKKTEITEVDIMKHLQIHVLCAQEMDDEKGDDLKPIHQETIPLKDCKPEKKKYGLYVNKKFNGGITVAFKLKPKFISPDDTKYVSSEGEWSREQTYFIPEEEDENEPAVFKLELDGKTATLSLNDDDVALTNFDQFATKFIMAFKRTLSGNETLVLSTMEGVLNEKSKMIKYATDSYTIKGEIHVPKVEKPPIPYSVQQPGDGGNIGGNIGGKGPGKGGGKGGGGAVKTGPKQISTIVVFAGQKKRVVLKNTPKKNVYEYTMDTLRSKLTKKFAAKGLNGHFNLQTDKGQLIQTDEEIVQYLADYKGEIQVTQ